MNLNSTGWVYLHRHIFTQLATPSRLVLLAVDKGNTLVLVPQRPYVAQSRSQDTREIIGFEAFLPTAGSRTFQTETCIIGYQVQ